MKDDLVNGGDAGVDLSSLIAHILINLRKMLVELEHLLVLNNAFQYPSVISRQVLSTPSSLDCSSYFEPVIDAALLVPEEAECTECCAPDFSDCFEPVAPGQYSQRIVG